MIEEEQPKKENFTSVVFKMRKRTIFLILSMMFFITFWIIAFFLEVLNRDDSYDGVTWGGLLIVPTLFCITSFIVFVFLELRDERKWK